MTEYEIKKLAQNERLIKTLQETNHILTRLTDSQYYYDEFYNEQFSLSELLHDVRVEINDLKERITGYDEDNGIIIEAIRSTVWTE